MSMGIHFDLNGQSQSIDSIWVSDAQGPFLLYRHLPFPNCFEVTNVRFITR